MGGSSERPVSEARAPQRVGERHCSLGQRAHVDCPALRLHIWLWDRGLFSWLRQRSQTRKLSLCTWYSQEVSVVKWWKNLLWLFEVLRSPVSSEVTR